MVLPSSPQPMQHLEQLRDVMEVQARRRLIQDVERAPGRALARAPAPASLAAPRRRIASVALWPRRDIREPHVDQRLQLARRPCGTAWKKRERLLDRHLEHLVDVLARGMRSRASARLYRCALHTSQGTYTSGRKCISTLMTPSPWHASQRPPLHVEAEPAGVVATGCAIRAPRRRAHATARTAPVYVAGVRPRRAADGALVDVDDAIDLLQPVDALHRSTVKHRAVQMRGRRA